MKIYIKNTNDNSIQIFEAESYESLSKNFRQSPYNQATKNEILAYELQEAKTSKIFQLQSAKDIALYTPVEYLGTLFVSSEKANQNILGALLLNGDGNEWLDVYGNSIILTKAQLKALGIIIKQQRSMVYHQKATLINQINACTTIKELNSINIEF